MSSVYPGGLDSFDTNRTDATPNATTQAADHNDYADAINQIEATLGVDPQGSFSTVVDRLDNGDSQPSGLAIFGDGGDGDVVVDSDTFDFPDLAGIDDWSPSTVYAVGDLVKSTGTTIRVFECVLAGVSDSVERFTDLAPGTKRRGDRTRDYAQGSPRDGTVVWEQATVICQGWLEGPLFADDFTVAAGVTLNVHGFPIYVKGTATIPATATLSANGIDAVGTTPGEAVSGFLDVQTLLGRGVDGVAANTAAGVTWGGGVGGFGGDGADGDGHYPGVPIGLDAAGFTLGRRMPQTLFSPFFFTLNSNGDNAATIGSGGGAGAADTGGGKSGGATGSCASAGAIFAKTLVFNGTLEAIGGAGGDGEPGGDTGGGGGSSGGCWVRVYNTQTGSGTVDVSGGAGGQGQGTGTDGQTAGPGEDVEIVNA